MPAPRVTQAQIGQAVAAVTGAGLTVTRVHVGADGSLTIDTAPAAAVVDMPPPRVVTQGPRQWAKG